MNSSLHAQLTRDTRYLADALTWSVKLTMAQHSAVPRFVRSIPLHVLAFVVRCHLHFRLLQGHGQD